MIKFISRAAVTEGEPFLIRCNCDALLMAETPKTVVTCQTCGATITPEVVGNQESISVQDPHTGEWKEYPVQGYKGERAPWTPKVGDVVGKPGGVERWRIESIKGSFAVLKLLANKKDTGVPVEMNHREEAPLSSLWHRPD